MRLIKTTLENGPLSINEIWTLVCRSLGKTSFRTVQNYLKELVELGDVDYNKEYNRYEKADAKKTYRSIQDYNLALEHSRNLLLSSKGKMRLDQTDPFLSLDQLVFSDTMNPRDVDDECLLQHLRTGYWETYSLVLKYRESMEKSGWSSSDSLPKLLGTLEVEGVTPMEMVSRAISLRDKQVREDDAEGQVATIEAMYSLQLKEKGREPKPLYSAQQRRELKELYDLRDLLVGRIYSLVNDVRNGIPLEGYCEFCPDRKITINDGSSAPSKEGVGRRLQR